MNNQMSKYQEDAYRSYIFANVLLGAPVFLIVLLALLFMFPLDNSASRAGEWAVIMLGIFGGLIFLPLVLPFLFLPAYLVGRAVKKEGLEYGIEGSRKAAYRSALYYLMFSLPLIIMFGLSGSNFVLLCADACIAGAVSSIIPSTMLPLARGKTKRRG